MRRVAWVVLCVVLPVSQACYTYVPLETTSPPVGETVAFQISDRGRVDLAPRFGPGLLRVEGLVTQLDSQDVVMNVFRVSQIGGLNSRWSGESVRLGRGFIGQLQQRKLSRPKTILLAGLVTGVVVGVVASQGLFGFFTGDPNPPPVDGEPEQSRIFARWLMNSLRTSR